MSPPASILVTGERALSFLAATPLYARVDGIRCSSEFRLLELELIEPALHFSMDREAAAVIERLKVKLPRFDAHVAIMSGGQRQAIAVARATVFARKLVILDEPTAALGVRESRRVLELIVRLRAEGNAVILVTHKMEHVVELADRAVVLRQGRKVGELKPDRSNRQELVSMIVGAET